MELMIFVIFGLVAMAIIANAGTLGEWLGLFVLLCVVMAVLGLW